MLIHTYYFDPVKAGGVINEQALTFGQYRLISGIPTDAQTFGDPRYGQVLADQTDQRPAQPGSADFLSWRHCLGEVFTPHSSAIGTSVAAMLDDQVGGPPAEGLVGDPADHGIAGNTRCTAGAAPRVRVGDVTDDFGFRFTQMLTGRGQAQLVQAGECREVGLGEGRIEQRRGLSKMGSVVTSILLGDLDFLVH